MEIWNFDKDRGDVKENSRDLRVPCLKDWAPLSFSLGAQIASTVSNCCA